MNKNSLLLSSLFLSGITFAQVGINNKDPKATLDISAKTNDGTQPEGLIVPRLTGDQIKAGDNIYTTLQTGTLIYATEAVGISSTKTANITSAGYYYFDGTVWNKVASPIEELDVTNDAWVNATGKVVLGTKSDGTARAVGTEVTVTDDGRIIVGADIGATISIFRETAGYERVDIGNTSDGPFSRTGFLARSNVATAVLESFSSTNAQGLGNPYDAGRVRSASLVNLGAFNANQLLIDTKNNAPIIFGTNATERMTILAGGNVGIKTATPNSNLHIAGSMSLPVRAFSGAVLETDHTVLGTGDVTLPSPANVTGRIYNFVFDGTNYSVNGDLRINGNTITSYGLNSNPGGFKITVQSTGTTWVIIDRN